VNATNRRRSPVLKFLRDLAFALVLTEAPLSRAAVIWLGPMITYNQPAPDPTQAANQDRITPDVWLTRAASKGLFNAYSETNATALSPAGTEWAFGALTNHASLEFTNWLGLLNGKSPTTLVGQPMVVHLTNDDIYIALDLSFWGSMSNGGFTYERSAPAPVNLSGGAVSNGQFTFNYTANEGQSYVVQSSSNLVDWTALATNVAPGNIVLFGDSYNSTAPRFYRVGQTPIP
jgi:hypothetical protein